MKKIISLLLALTLAASLFPVAAVSASAAESNAPAWWRQPDAKLYFYADPTYWYDFQTIYVYLYDRDDDALFPWGSKKGAMTDEGNNIWSFDTEAAGIRFSASGHYGVIFAADWNQQTRDLIVDSECLGDMAYITNAPTAHSDPGSVNESRKAAWVNGDPRKYGAPIVIDSIGNVSGDVYWNDESAYTLFVRFLSPSSYTGITNAVKFNGMTVRQTAAYTAEQLGLSEAEFNRAVQEAGIDLDNYPLPWVDSACIYFETAPYFTENNETVSAFIYATGEESLYPWGSTQYNMEPLDDTTWMYDLTKHGFTDLTGKEYYVVFTAGWKNTTDPLPLRGHNWDVASLTGKTVGGTDTGVYQAKWYMDDESIYPWFWFEADETVIGEAVTDVYAYIYEENGDGIFEGKGSEVYRMTYEGENYWLYDLSLSEYVLKPNRSYSVMFYINGFDGKLRTVSLPISALYAGETARLTGGKSAAANGSTVSFDAAWDTVEPTPNWTRRHDSKLYFFADPNVLPATDGVTAELYCIDAFSLDKTLLTTVAMTPDETEPHVWSLDVKEIGFSFAGDSDSFFGIVFKTHAGETMAIDFDARMLGDMAYPFPVSENEIWAVWYNNSYDVPYGDLNGDSEMTVQDVTLLQRYLAEFKNSNGEPILDDYTIYLADFNRDGFVNIADATDMQRSLAEFD